MKLNFTGTDLCAINGTRSPPEARYDVVVVGAGASGTAAAIAAAKAGASVLLVDENPVSGALMGNDVPLYFGGRMTAATQNSERMLEAIFMSAPALDQAMEAGVEVLLGTSAWGSIAMVPASRACPNRWLVWRIAPGHGWSGLTGSCWPPARAIWRWLFPAGTSPG